MEKYGFVYLWYDSYRKMYYLGCHWGTIDDGYICSSNRMRDAHRRRPDDFKRRILNRIYTNKRDLLETEFKWLSKIKTEELGKRYYNLRQHHWGHWSSDINKTLSIGQKISNTNKGRKFPGRKVSPEGKQKMKGRIFTEEHKQKISNSKKGKTLTEEHKEKLKNRNISEKTKQKLKLASKHTPLTNEHKEKLKNSQYWIGENRSIETRQKISKSLINNNCRAKKWKINGDEISNLKEYCRNNNLSYKQAYKSYKSRLPYGNIIITEY